MLRQRRTEQKPDKNESGCLWVYMSNFTAMTNVTRAYQAVMVSDVQNTLKKYFENTK